MGDRLPLARGLPPCPSLPSSSSRDRGPADPLGHPSGFQVGKLWPASSSGPAAIRTGTRAAQRQPSLSPSPSCAHPGWSGGSQRRLSPRLSPLRLLPGSNPAQGLAQTLLLPPLTLGWVCPLGGKEGHPTLSNPGGSQPRTERDGGKAKSYESCDLMRGCVPGISNPCPMSHQFITDVTLEKREVGPHPSQTLSINAGADGADAWLRPGVGGGWTRTVHSPPRTVALASSGRGRSQLTDVLLATSRTPWLPLPPKGPAGPFPLGAGSSGPSMAGGGLTAKGSACRASLCGESRGQGSAAVLASLGGWDQRGRCPRVRAQEASAPLPCLTGSQAPPRAGPPPRTAQCHPEQTPSGA